MTETTKPKPAATNLENEILTSPFALGEAVGKSGSFPAQLRMPVDGLKEKDWPIATFWLFPWDLAVAERLHAKDVAPLPNVADPVEMARQGVEVAQIIIDRNKGWENLIRFDGSEFKYKVPTDDEIGTDKDVRVQLSRVGGFFGLVKGKSVGLAFQAAQDIEKNSATSSAITTDEVRPFVENHPSFKSD